MENVPKFLKLTFNLAIFFIGITQLYAMSNNYHKLVNLSSKQVLESQTVYQNYSHEKDNYISLSKLIAHLMGNLEYNMEIKLASKRYLISCKEHKPEEIGQYDLPDIDYKKIYQYDLNGNIDKIIFEGIMDECI